MGAGDGDGVITERARKGKVGAAGSDVDRREATASIRDQNRSELIELGMGKAGQQACGSAHLGDLCPV